MEPTDSNRRQLRENDLSPVQSLNSGGVPRPTTRSSAQTSVDAGPTSRTSAIRLLQLRITVAVGLTVAALADMSMLSCARATTLAQPLGQSAGDCSLRGIDGPLSTPSTQASSPETHPVSTGARYD